jgi:hypothetical protein
VLVAGGGGVKTKENKNTLAPLSLQLARETGMGWGQGAKNAEAGKSVNFYTNSFFHNSKIRMEGEKLYFIQFGFPNTQLWELMQELFSTIDPGCTSSL